MSGLFRRRRREVPRAADEPYDPRPAEAAYRRLLELAQDLRRSAAELSAAAARVEMREAALRRAVGDYDRIAQAAIAGGRTIQAESAIASGEAAAATLDALVPQAAEIADRQADLERAVARIEAEAATLRARLDAAATAQAVSGARARLHETAATLAGHRTTLAAVVTEAEDEAVRLEARARALAELYGETSGDPSP
jgi:phage shock protein A